MSSKYSTCVWSVAVHLSVFISFFTPNTTPSLSSFLSDLLPHNWAPENILQGPNCMKGESQRGWPFLEGHTADPRKEEGQFLFPRKPSFVNWSQLVAAPVAPPAKMTRPCHWQAEDNRPCSGKVHWLQNFDPSRLLLRHHCPGPWVLWSHPPPKKELSLHNHDQIFTFV